MSGILSAVASMLAAGTLLVSTPLKQAAPQNDISGTLFLVNRSWRVSRDYVPSGLTGALKDTASQKMRAEAAAALREMFEACKEETGVTLTTVSGYRSYSKQSSIYNRKLNRTGSQEKADEYVARPGASEHQLGLAMDVNQRRSNTGLTDAFADTEGGKWLAANCSRFGFILRYQAGWEEITGYKYESWHVRYVGKEYSAAITEANVPFETYLLALRESVLTEIVTGK